MFSSDCEQADSYVMPQNCTPQIAQMLTDYTPRIAKMFTDEFLVNEPEFLFKEETYRIIGVCMEVHKELGHGFREVVYKDAIEFEFAQRNISFEREKEYQVLYKGKALQHCFYADFVVFGNIILELKAVEGGISDDNLAQTLNYLKASNCKVGLLINFGRRKLEYKRLVF